jgi:hypothetical protein
VLVFAFADLDDRIFGKRFDLATAEPHSAGPLHCGHHRVEDAIHDEDFLFGDAKQVVVVRAALDDRAGGVVEIRRLVNDNGRITRPGDDCPLTGFERRAGDRRSPRDADHVDPAVGK